MDQRPSQQFSSSRTMRKKAPREDLYTAAQAKTSLEGATDWIRFDDLPFVQHLDIEMYGPEETVDMNITYRWWERNPHMCRILYNAQDRRDIWGALTIMPLPEALIHRLLK